MERTKKSALEAAGFCVGDAEDFLDLSDQERQLVELRVSLSRTVRKLREQHHLTQQQLAKRLTSSQSRVAKLEAGMRDVSLDLLFRGLFAVGGTVADVSNQLKAKGLKSKTAKGSAREYRVTANKIGVAKKHGSEPSTRGHR